MRNSLIALSAAATFLIAVGADAQKSGRQKKDEKKQQKVQRKDEKRQQQSQRQAERRDRDCTKEIGPGAVWSAAQNRCLPPKAVAPKKEAKPGGGTMGAGRPAPAKAQPPAPRGMGQSCGMVANTMMSCRAPFVCVDKVCKNPRDTQPAAKASEGQKCGPAAGGAFIRCADGLRCAPATNTCSKAVAASTPPKTQPTAAPRKAAAGRLCGNVKSASGQVERVDCEAGLTCKPSTKVAGLGSCQKAAAATAAGEKKQEPAQAKGAPPIVGVDTPKEYGQCSLVVKFSAPAEAKEIKLYYARPGSPPYNREWDELSRWRDETSIKVGGGSSDCGGAFKFKLCATYAVTAYQNQERCTPVQTRQAPPKE